MMIVASHIFIELFKPKSYLQTFNCQYNL
uniref:Uncharacterized protein n=1 Tax=Lepeophtheirus salmonis TaxID=72036 RepID=A0A0K2TQG7_LEPSM